jgi:hypothetical protein
MSMTDLDNLARWQAMMDMAVYKFEKRTGLNLAGLSPPEIAERIKKWTSANRSLGGRTHELSDKEASEGGNGPGTNSEVRNYASSGSSITL